MAKNTVTIKIDPTKITRKSGIHLSRATGGYKYRKSVYIELPSTSGLASMKEDSYFNVPLNLPFNCEITNIKIPLEQYKIGIYDGSTYVWVVEGVEYRIDDYGNLIDSSLVNAINSYKIQQGKFPELVLKIGSWVFRSSEYNAIAEVTIYAPIITCKINGVQSTHRPVADVSVGHSIPTGFSTIYDLLDETVSDGSVSCISTISYSQTGVYEETSVVKMSALQNAPVHQIRLLASLCMTEADISCRADVDIYLRVNGKEASFLQRKESDNECWKKNEYYIFEGVLSNDSSLIKEINAYYEQHKRMPDVEVALRTVAAGYTDNKGSTNAAISEISQVYLEVVYTNGIGVYQKTNGQYKEAETAYKKVGRLWIEISESECRETLKNNNILTG